MNEPSARRRLGNTVVRRRLDATSVIELNNPKQEGPTSVNRTVHAKYFVVAVVVIILCGALLLMLPFAAESGKSTPFVDALFVSTSAFSVTGLITVDTQDH